jgi:hypothetical protein
MTANHEFIITRHIRERYVQRTNKRFSKLQWDEGDQALKNEFDDLLKNKQKEIDQEILQRLENATESRSYINNSGFMEWHFEKYGYDKRFSFLVNDNILFVAIVEKGRKIVVTCVSAKTHLAGKAVLDQRRKKFKKKSSEQRSL